MNEFFILLYKTLDNNLKYKQIKVDIDRLKILKCEEQKQSERDNERRVIETENYINGFIKPLNSTLGINQSEYNFNYEDLLFDNFNKNLRLEITISEFNENTLEDILIYTEEVLPSINELKCSFNPQGETKFDCIQMCTQDQTNNCDLESCSELCRNCSNLDCKWNITDYNINESLKPEAARIKAFSGDKAIKVTWIRPLSKFPVDKYYLTLTNISTNTANIYKFDSSAEINEYVINQLQSGQYTI